jgi:nucleotide-binding universal stress UspA family protein
MFTRILIPLDGSTFAEQSLSVAVALSQAWDADVALIRTVEVLAPGDHEPGVISYLDEHRATTAQDYVAAIAARLRTPRPVSAEAYLATDIPAGILARAQELDVDLILMASHGAFGPITGVMGGLAAHLTREARCPVLLVGPHVEVPPLPAHLAAARGV